MGVVRKGRRLIARKRGEVVFMPRNSGISAARIGSARQILEALFRHFRRLHQSAFAGLPGTIDEDGRCVLQSFEKVLGNVATDHGCIINHNLDVGGPAR